MRLLQLIENLKDAPEAISLIRALGPQLIAAAQAVYDEWDQTDEYDELNGGGICDQIAEAMADIMNTAGYETSTICANDEQHVYCVCRLPNGVFSLDIPYRIYEFGGGFSWTKIPDIVFEVDHLSLFQLDPDPDSFEQYTDN